MTLHCFDTSAESLNGASRAVGTHHGPTRIHAPTTAYAIGGTATLAQRYSITTAAARTLPPAGDDCWPPGLLVMQRGSHAGAAARLDGLNSMPDVSM